MGHHSKNYTPTGRPRGRPRRDSRVIGNAELEKIAELRLRGQSLSAIGKVLGVDGEAIRHHLKATIEPAWRQSSKADASIEIAKINHLEKTAWERWSRSLQPETLRDVRRELESPDGANLYVVKKVLRKMTRHKVGETCWLQVIQWCIETRCKILGMFANKPIDVNLKMSGELRVAGMTPAEIDGAMAQRLAERVAESRKRLAEQLGNGAN